MVKEVTMLLMEDLLTVEEVAQRLRVSKDTVWRWIRNKELTGVRVAGSWRIYQSDLKKFIEAQRKNIDTQTE